MGIVKLPAEKADYIEKDSMLHTHTHPETDSYISAVTRPTGRRSASITSLYVPEEHRGKGIGKLLLNSMMNEFPSIQGQISSKAAAKNAYKSGRRLAGNESASLEDIYKKIDEDSSANMWTHKAIGGGTFSGAKTPAPQQLARVADKFIYHSGTVDQLDDMKWGLEPQHGDWIKEMSRHAGDIEPDELLEQSTPLVWMSDKPSWVAMKVARKLGKHPHDITDDEIRQHGHVAVIPRKGDHAEHIWHVGDEGLSNGEYSPVTNLKGETKKAGWTDLYDHDDRKQPFGVERNEYVSAQPVEPMFHLTGQDLVDFLHASGNRLKKADGGDVDGDGITAYHGSPHDFDEFDTSKIGTGEGAQAYGHGLYFAEHEPVAMGYRDELSKNRPLPLQIDGERHYPYTRMQRMVAEHRGDVDAVLAGMAPNWGRAISDHASLPHDADEFERMLVEDAAKHAHKERAEVEAMRGKSVGYGKRGHMYEVHINAHPHHMLDWDKPLSEQSEHVQTKLEQLAANDEKKYGYGNGLHYYFTDPDSYSGGNVHKYLAEQYGPEDAAKFLHGAGIKGIKYLDAGSRGDKAEPTHNYVVFDHNDVRVKRKYERGGRVRFSQGGTDSYDYRGEHQAPGPEDGAPLHDLTKVYPDDVYGPNGFQYYGETGDPSDRANFSLVQSMRGKPNAPVTMYRAVPNVPSVAKELAKLEEDMANYQRRGRLPRDAWTTDKTRWYDSSAHQRDLLREKAEKEKLNPPAEIGINAGDWVTTNRQYAKDHGESALNGNYKILTKKARAKELFTAGDSHHEWGYHPEKKAEGGAVDNDVIPHGDPKREQNLTEFHGKTPDEIKNTRWYHGTPSSFDKFNKGHKGIFVTKDPEFAHEFMHNYSDDEDQHEKLANHAKNIMPLHVKAENPFDYENADHVNKLMPHIPSHMRNSTVKENLQAGAWDELEHPDVQKAIKKLGHDSYFVNEDGNKNLALYDPTQIKSATGNNGNFDPTNPDITKADGGEVDDHYIGEHYQDGGEVDPPKKKVKAYKLFRTDPKKPGKLFPLFVDANTPVPIKKWVEAKAGDPGKDPTKVKSKLGDLAYRPGWHAGDLPVATHIGGKSSSDLKAPDYRPDNHVWAEIEMPNDVDWQSEANSRVQYTKAGKPKPATAHITDQVPLGGHYRYKTNPNMTGNWLIGGSMKVNRILKDDEVKAINDANGVADLPRLPRAPETKARGGPIATSGPIVKRALELLSKDRTGR